MNPIFAITLEINSLELIKDIARFFGCGNIIVTGNSASFRVTSFYHIWHIIIPHFLNYPFSGRKFLVFKTFTICCALMLPFYHKTLPYKTIFSILYLSFMMNEGTKRSLEALKLLLLSLNMKVKTQKSSNIKLFNKNLISSVSSKALNINKFPTEFNILSTDYSLIKPSYNIELPYILGIFDGDGSFFIRFLSSSYIYSFGFNITTSIEDLPILILIKNRLGCGQIIIHETWCRLDINRIKDLIEIIIPLVDSLVSYRGTGQGLLSHKAKYYIIWKEGIIRHLNNEFAFTKCTSAQEMEAKKLELKNYIIRAYNLHDQGKKRKITLQKFLKNHGLD